MARRTIMQVSAADLDVFHQGLALLYSLRKQRDTAQQEWRDLGERLTRALRDLEELNSTDRLDGKIQGVKLALSYMDETERSRGEG